MRVLLLTLMLGLAQPAFAQQAKTAKDEPIVVTGIANGARIVEVDFDKVWKNCAECKRALAKLDRLAEPYRDEVSTALLFIDRPAPPPGSPAPTRGVTNFSRSTAENTEDWTARSGSELVISLDGERHAEMKRAHFGELKRRYINPEQVKLAGHMRSFLDQLAPHVVRATEAERIANRATFGLIDTKRTKLSAKKLTRINVTDAVIRRLDAMDFTIELPEPVPSPARR